MAKERSEEALSRILSRQSCRAYTGKAVTKEEISEILAAGRCAPSACNTQPWHLYGICGEKLKELLPCLNPRFEKIGGAIVIATVPKELPVDLPGAKPNPFLDIDLGLVTLQMALYAEGMGIASCIVGAFKKEEAAEILGIPAEEKPRLVLVLGEAEDPALREKDRLPLSDVATVF